METRYRKIKTISPYSRIRIYISAAGRRSVPIACWISLATLLVACAAPVASSQLPPATFAARCSAPGVIRCFGFEPNELAAQGGSIEWSNHDAAVGTFVNGMEDGANLSGRVELATDHKASGESSLKFYMPSQSGPAYSGQFYANFSDDYSVQFGEGDEFFVQWRQRFSRDFLDNRYRPRSNWKQVIVGEGDRPDHRAWSCTQLELVVNQSTRGVPAMYHSCGGKDDQYEPIEPNRAINYEPEQWMTFQVHVRVGTWYKNDRKYRYDSLVELWAAKEGERSRLILSRRHDLANNDLLAKYGKVWLLPYLSDKDSSQKHPDAVTWYDDLVISRHRIPDPIL